jgi:splicing factor U2AF 65 kDa subunit
MANEIPRLSHASLPPSTSPGLSSGNAHSTGYGQPPQLYYSAGPPRNPSYGERGPRIGQAHVPLNKSRRLYVGNIPYHVGIAEYGMVQLFSALYVAAFRPLNEGEPLPVSSFWLHADGKFGFMELRGDAEAVDIMQLNGIVLHGRALRVNRPSDYRPEVHGPAAIAPSKINVAAVLELCSQLGGIVAAPAHLIASAAASDVLSRPNMLIPTSNGANPSAPSAPASPPTSALLSTVEVSPAAPLNVPSAATFSTAAVGVPIGQQADSAVQSVKQTAMAVAEIPHESHGASPGGQTVIGDLPSGSARASNVSLPILRSQPQKQHGDILENCGQKQLSDVSPGFVVCLRNLVTNEDLDGKQDDYNDIVDDVRDECSRYGNVVDISIPREGGGRGTAFIAYHTLVEASKAIDGLRKLVFSGRSIEAYIVPDVSTVEQAAANCL